MGAASTKPAPSHLEDATLLALAAASAPKGYNAMPTALRIRLRAAWGDCVTVEVSSKYPLTLTVDVEDGAWQPPQAEDGAEPCSWGGVDALLRAKPQGRTSSWLLSHMRLSFVYTHHLALSDDAAATVATVCVSGRGLLHTRYQSESGPWHWEPDAKRLCCPLCSSDFHYATRWKHHCRACGRLVCAECSGSVAVVKGEAEAQAGCCSAAFADASEARRVCDDCYYGPEMTCPLRQQSDADTPRSCATSEGSTSCYFSDSGHLHIRRPLNAHELLLRHDAAPVWRRPTRK